MPSAPRPKGKALKIFTSIMDKPISEQKRTPNEEKIDAELVRQRSDRAR